MCRTKHGAGKHCGYWLAVTLRVGHCEEHGKAATPGVHSEKTPCGTSILRHDSVPCVDCEG